MQNETQDPSNDQNSRPIGLYIIVAATITIFAYIVLSEAGVF